MPASPSRHRLVAALAGGVLVLGLLGGCATQSTPDSYTASVERNFMRGCVGTAEEDGLDDVEDYCQCVFDTLKEDVPFSTFKEVNSDQTDDPAPLPESFTSAYEDCETPR